MEDKKIITTGKDTGEECPYEFLARIQQELRKEGVRKPLFRILELEREDEKQLLLSEAYQHHKDSSKFRNSEDFIVAVSQVDAALYLNEHEGTKNIEIYDRENLLETIHSDRGVYQIPPVPTFKWAGRRIR